MEKIKLAITTWVEGEKGKGVLTVMIIVLVGFGAFELGRLSKENTSSGVQIEYNQPAVAEEANVFSAVEYASIPKNNVSKSSSKNFFASNRGSKYYPVGCSGGKTIKQENRVYFVTSEEAEKAGYTLSSSCH
jgi:hypothetical protein